MVLLQDGIPRVSAGFRWISEDPEDLGALLGNSSHLARDHLFLGAGELLEPSAGGRVFQPVGSFLAP